MNESQSTNTINKYHHLLHQQVQNERIVAARLAAANDASNKWRIILSIGLLLPALAAIVGIVAWAISIEVASDSSHQASSNTMFIKPVNNKQRSSSVPSSLPLIASPNHNNHHHNGHQRIRSKVAEPTNNGVHNSRISFNTNDKNNNNQYSDDGSNNVQALTSTANLNIKSSHITTDEKELEPKIGDSSIISNNKDDTRKKDDKIIRSSVKIEDNKLESRDDVPDSSSNATNRKQQQPQEKDKDYSNNDQNNNNNNNKNEASKNGEHQPSVNTNVNGNINAHDGGNNNKMMMIVAGNNDNNKHSSSHHHNDGQQHKTTADNILPKNKGVLAQSVYQVVLSAAQQDNLSSNSRNDQAKTAEQSNDNRKTLSESTDQSNNNNQSHVDMNDFEAIANAIATTITATATESDFLTETNSDSTTPSTSLGNAENENVDFANTDDVDQQQASRRSPGEHVAEVIDHIVEQRRQQQQAIRSSDGSIANSDDGDNADNKMPQIVVVAPVGGGQHLMKAHSLVKVQDANKEIVKKPTNQTLVAKTKKNNNNKSAGSIRDVLLTVDSQGEHNKNSDKDTNKQQQQQQQQQQKKVSDQPNPLYSYLRSKNKAHPLAARLIGPQTTTLTPFELDSLNENSNVGPTKQVIRYSEPVEVINDDTDVEDKIMLRSESQPSPIMMMALSANNNDMVSSTLGGNGQQNILNNNQQQGAIAVANMAAVEPTMSSDDQHHRTLLISNDDATSQLLSEYQASSHLSQAMSQARSRLPRHEQHIFGLVKEARDSVPDMARYNMKVKSTTVASTHQKHSSASNDEDSVTTDGPLTSNVKTAEQIINDHISRSTQRLSSQPSNQRDYSLPPKQHQTQKQHNVVVIRTNSQNNMPADNVTPMTQHIAIDGSKILGTNLMRSDYERKHRELSIGSGKSHSVEHDKLNQEMSVTTTTPTTSTTTEQSASSSSPSSSVSEYETINNRFTNRASNVYQHSDSSDNIRPHSMIESKQHQQQQHYPLSAAEYAPAQSMEQAVQSQQVVTIEYPSNKQQQQAQLLKGQAGQSSLPQFADQEYNVPAHLAETVINDLQKSASTPEIYQGPMMQQQQQNSNHLQQLQLQPQQLTDEQQIELIGQIFRMQESDIRSRIAQGKSSNNDLAELEYKKRLFALHVSRLNKQQNKSDKQSLQRSSSHYFPTFLQQQQQPQLSMVPQQHQLIPTLMSKGSPVSIDSVVANSRQPRIADRMQVMHQQPSLISPALALQRVLGGSSITNQLKATPRQGNNLASPSTFIEQQQPLPSDGQVAPSQDQEPQESYGQMPAYHMPHGGGGYGGGGEHHYGGNDYEPQHDKKSKGMTFHFGGGPIGGGSQLITSPMGIFKNLVLPLMPSPNVHMTGKVVFGVVLEKSTGFGAQKKKSYKFWGR